ncbi:MAG: NifB/NifX family molybdenum-iron cluster-binding protein [Planctomycetes bacterium]|nr:NifB/NifX family molybdenum-iron cluster-binding protein [Planctomycetota bacterium]
MKVAISATAASLEATIDPRFGRSAHLLIVDTGSGQIVGGGRNEFADAKGGAGTNVAQRVVDAGAEAVLTGSVGPKAIEVLLACKVRCYVGAKGTVREALAALERGELKETKASTAPGRGGRS